MAWLLKCDSGMRPLGYQFAPGDHDLFFKSSSLFSLVIKADEFDSLIRNGFGGAKSFFIDDPKGLTTMFRLIHKQRGLFTPYLNISNTSKHISRLICR